MRAIGLVFSLAALLMGASAAVGADQVLKDIDAVKVPTLDPTKTDTSQVRAQQIKIKDAASKRARLIRELYKVAPDHKRMAGLLEERWKTIGPRPEKGQYAEFLQELDHVIAHTKDKTLKIEAAYLKAELKLNPVSNKRAPDPSGVEEFV
jgi:hypothetical protein